MFTETRQEKPMNTTVRRTSVYTLRVALPPTAGTNDVNRATARLYVAALHHLGSALISDSHGSVSGWDFPTGGPAPYGSVSLRIPTDDADALDLAGRIAAEAGHPAGWVLTTGLGAHRRTVTAPAAP